jgi:hypothetical protein
MKEKAFGLIPRIESKQRNVLFPEEKRTRRGKVANELSPYTIREVPTVVFSKEKVEVPVSVALIS